MTTLKTVCSRLLWGGVLKDPKNEVDSCIQMSFLLGVFKLSVF